MNLNNAIEFANEVGGCYLATLDGDQSRVRGMRMWFADDTGFYFHTGTGKRLSDQVQSGAKVEAAFHDRGDDPTLPGRVMRVTGITEVLQDTTLEKRLFEERAWLNAVFAAFPNDRIVIFRIPHGEIQFWDMSVNNREKDLPVIPF